MINDLRYKDHIGTVILFILTGIISVLNAVELNYSFERMTGLTLGTLLTESLIAFAFHLLFYSLIRKQGISSLTVSFLINILAIADRYIYLYHGEPFLPQDIADFGTAMNVASGYSFRIDSTMVKMLAVFAASVVISVVQLFIEKGLGKKKQSTGNRLLKTATGIVLSFVILALVFFTIRPAKTDQWSFRMACSENGYLFEFINAANNIVFGKFLIMPEGYSIENTEALIGSVGKQAEAAKDRKYPDIIFVLNESWYDLSKVCEPETDADYMKNYRDLDACIKGYAVVPSIGGGTNRSEFELLKSDSLSILQKEIIPFSWLDFEGAKSAVSYLEGLGYSTMACHGADGSNYRRDICWPELGFDIIHFVDDFSMEDTGYGNRTAYITDSDSVSQFIQMMDEMPEDRPRFAYLLTMQNHGPFDLNDSSYDQVHAGKDFGEIDEEVDEYLTCIKLTDDSIKELTDHFRNSDRDTLILMVGDHAPSFIRSVADGEKYEGIQLEIAEKSTPFFIWTNFDTGSDGQPDTEANPDLCSLGPLAFRAAGLPETVYYSSVLDLAEKDILQSMSGVDTYLTADGVSHEAEGMEEMLKRYYYLEYNSLKGGSSRIDGAFEAGLKE